MDSFDYTTPDVLTTTLGPMLKERTYPEFKASKVIIVYGMPLLMLLGAFSNIISLIVLRSKSFRTSSVSFSLSVLSVNSLLILFVPGLRLWVMELTDRRVDFRVTSVVCKVHIMLTYLLGHLSSWTLVLIVLERTFIVCFPLASKPWCTRKNTCIVWSVTAFVLFLVNSHFFWTFDYAPDPTHFSYYKVDSTEEPITFQPIIHRISYIESKGHNYSNLTGDYGDTSTANPQQSSHNDTANQYQKVCYAIKDYYYFINHVWPWIDNILTSILPFFLLLGGNVAIVITIAKATKFRKESTVHHTSISAKSSCGHKAARTSNRKKDKFLIDAVINDTSGCPGVHQSKSGTMERMAEFFHKPRKLRTLLSSMSNAKDGQKSSTYMLVGASIFFLLLTMPSGVYLMTTDYLITDDATPASMAKYRLAFSVTIFLYYLNNSINFIIYYLTGSRFRKSFIDFFSRPKERLSSEARLSEEGTNVTRVKL